MCDRVSGTCHRYSVGEIGGGRVVEVEYSNPDEWGSEHPFSAVFPVLRDLYGKGAHGVVLHIHDTRREPRNLGGEGWQSFDVLRDCPELFRHPVHGWGTREEIDAAMDAAKLAAVPS